ncbi:hypothetical protein PMAYCL1PPCAC_20543, partial [Pristionchus mayeri]
CLWKPLCYPLVMYLWFLWEELFQECSERRTAISIGVPRHNNILFKLRLASQLELAQLLRRRSNEELQEVYKFDFESMDNNSKMLDHLRNCMGDLIDDLEIDYDETLDVPSLPNDVLAQIIDGIQFKRLRIYHAEISDDFANLLEKHLLPSLDHISLVYTRMSDSNQGNFLLNVSSYVRHVFISDFRDTGLSGVDCADLIARMFSNKMEKLEVQFFTPGCIELLRDKLPTVGRKLCFAS